MKDGVLPRRSCHVREVIGHVVGHPSPRFVGDLASHRPFITPSGPSLSIISPRAIRLPHFLLSILVTFLMESGKRPAGDAPDRRGLFGIARSSEVSHRASSVARSPLCPRHRRLGHRRPTRPMSWSGFGGTSRLLKPCSKPSRQRRRPFEPSSRTPMVGWPVTCHSSSFPIFFLLVLAKPCSP